MKTLRHIGQWFCVCAWMVHDDCGPYWLRRICKDYASVIFYFGVWLNKRSGNLIISSGDGEDAA